MVGPEDPSSDATGDAKLALQVTDGGVRRSVPVSGHRLYVLRDSDEPVEQELRIDVPDGLAVYAFTFG